MTDLTTIPLEELYRVLGLIECDRMLWSFGPEREAEMDEKATMIEAEISRRSALNVQEGAS